MRFFYLLCFSACVALGAEPEPPGEVKVCALGDQCYPKCVFDGGWFPWCDWYEWDELGNWTRAGHGKMKWKRVQPSLVKLKCVDGNKESRVDLKFVHPPGPVVRVIDLTAGDGEIAFTATCEFAHGSGVRWSFDPELTSSYLTVSERSLWAKIVPGEDPVFLRCSVLLNGYRYASRGVGLDGQQTPVLPCRKSRKYLMNTHVREPVMYPREFYPVFSPATNSTDWFAVEKEKSRASLSWGNETLAGGEKLLVYRARGGNFSEISSSDSGLVFGDGFVETESRMEDGGRYLAVKGNESIRFDLSVFPRVDLVTAIDFFQPDGVLVSCVYEGWFRGDVRTVRPEDVDFVIRGQYGNAERRGSKMYVLCNCADTAYPSQGDDGFPTCRFRVYCVGKTSFGRVVRSGETFVNVYQRRGGMRQRPPTHSEL